MKRFNDIGDMFKALPVSLQAEIIHANLSTKKFIEIVSLFYTNQIHALKA